MIDEERRRELEDQRRCRELEEQRRRRELEERLRLQTHQQRLCENEKLERDAGSSSRSSGGFFANLFGGSGFSNFSSVKYSAVSNEAISLDFPMPAGSIAELRDRGERSIAELMDRGERLEALVTMSKDLSASSRKFKRLADNGARDRDQDRVAKAVVQDAAGTTKPRNEAAQGAPEGQQAAHSCKAPEAATQCDPDPAPAEEAPPDHSPQPEQQAESIEEPEALDYTSIPAALDARCNELGGGAALRPVIIKAGSKWSRRSKNLVGIPKDATLGADQQREERNSAFDLLDALTCSGSLTVDSASLHVVLLVAHCFEKALLDMLVQENVNPLDPVERSSLILASTIHGKSVEQLLQPAELPRVSQHSPALVAPGPAKE
uniref:V-SNARE coiled-coil homology domain-containing protein n=1 Tax=Alexandrium catenella TaxID=2925 RepID=A0A7S1MF12_ALECA